MASLYWVLKSPTLRLPLGRVINWDASLLHQTSIFNYADSTSLVKGRQHMSGITLLSTLHSVLLRIS